MTDRDVVIELVVFLTLTRARRVWLKPDVFARVERQLRVFPMGCPYVPTYIGDVPILPRSEFHGS